ncbi:hypothetical protein TWF281_006599 [Arthrobotrys megalospora]
MVAISKPAFAILAVFNLFTGTSAAPASKPELTDYLSLIKVAPGLPTPKELGLTNEFLNNPIPEHAAHQARELLSKRYNPVCWPGVPQCSIADAAACFAYLNSLGSQRCVVNPGTSRVRMCVAGSCGWYGRPEIVRNGASSTCVTVAAGGNWVLGNCRVPLVGTVAGSNAAYGNGNFLVDIARVGYFD